jgi:hypothetical protein
MSQIEFLENNFDESDLDVSLKSPEREFFWEFLKLFYKKGAATLEDLKKLRKKINCSIHLGDIIFQLIEMGVILKSVECIQSCSPGAPFNTTSVYSLTPYGKNFIEKYL